MVSANRTRRRARRWTAGRDDAVMVAVALLVFFVLIVWWDGLIAKIVAGVVAGTAGATAWWVMRRISARGPGPVLTAPRLGEIPDESNGPAPVLTDPDGRTGRAFFETARALEAATHGQVLMVTSPGPGQGATTVAMNLAMAASLSGRRVLLIDADLETRGLSRFGGSGPAPGLTDLAAGTVPLRDGARLWNLSPTARLPFIPAGSMSDDPDTILRSPRIADMVDRITERADLVFIDSPPVMWRGVSPDLAAHADGTVLVVPQKAQAASLTEAADKLSDIGAPVLGYVVNRTPVVEPRGEFMIRLVKRAAALATVLILAFLAWTGFTAWDSWRNIAREELSTQDARTEFDQRPTTSLAPDVEGDELGNTAATGRDDDYFDAYLVIGTDARAAVGGSRADAIILVLLPRTADPAMVSIPRDLYLPNRCTGGYTRINAGLNGCRDPAVNGMTLLAINVEDFTGIGVDHAVVFDFDGFTRIIDAVGGVRICVEQAVRDRESELDLPAGCTIADGDQALAWVRSRKTQENVDGVWRTMSGVNDLTRNQRQQDVILQMFAKMNSLRSIGELNSLVRSLSDAFVLDESIGVGDVIDLAWGLRDLETSTVGRLTIPVTGKVTTSGAEVLVPTSSFGEVIGAAYPEFPGSPG